MIKSLSIFLTTHISTHGAFAIDSYEVRHAAVAYLMPLGQACNLTYR